MFPGNIFKPGAQKSSTFKWIYIQMSHVFENRISPVKTVGGEGKRISIKKW